MHNPAALLEHGVPLLSLVARSLTAGIALCIGCAGGAQLAAPESAIHAYINAVQAEDIQAAYALLDPRTQEQVPYALFAEQMTSNATELRQQTEEIALEAADEGILSRAEIHMQGGESAVLTVEEGRWKLLGGILDAPALLTPVDAVLAMRHALQRRDLAALLRVLSRATRADLESDIHEFLTATDDPLDLQTEAQGNHAVVQVTGGLVIRLQREAGEWRVVDFDDGQQQ